MASLCALLFHYGVETKMPKKSEKNEVRLFARMPHKLKKMLSVSAKKSGRSLTAELVIRLSHSLNENKFIEKMPNFSNKE